MAIAAAAIPLGARPCPAGALGGGRPTSAPALAGASAAPAAAAGAAARAQAAAAAALVGAAAALAAPRQPRGRRRGGRGELPRRAVGLPLREPEAGTTVALPGAKVEENPDYKRAEEYSLLLFNDPLNKREFVARCLMLICLLEERPAFETMMKAHEEGVAVVGTYKFDTAEDYCARLKAKGIISDIISKDNE